jgi:hypothetical protein
LAFEGTFFTEENENFTPRFSIADCSMDIDDDLEDPSIMAPPTPSILRERHPRHTGIAMPPMNQKACIPLKLFHSVSSPTHSLKSFSSSYTAGAPVLEMSASGSPPTRSFRASFFLRPQKSVFEDDDDEDEQDGVDEERSGLMGMVKRSIDLRKRRMRPSSPREMRDGSTGGGNDMGWKWRRFMCGAGVDREDSD